VISRLEDRFLKLYRQLPYEIRQQAREAYKQWRINPNHPGLRFKLISGQTDIYSVRINRSYRAVAQRVAADEYVWFFIGTHDDYERVIGQR
jgi:hypothetical protein